MTKAKEIVDTIHEMFELHAEAGRGQGFGPATAALKFLDKKDELEKLLGEILPDHPVGTIDKPKLLTKNQEKAKKFDRRGAQLGMSIFELTVNKIGGAGFELSLKETECMDYIVWCEIDKNPEESGWIQ